MVSPMCFDEECLSLLKDMVRLRSTNDDLNGQKQLAEMLERELRGIGFEVQLLPLWDTSYEEMNTPLMKRLTLHYSTSPEAYERDRERYIVYAQPRDIQKVELGFYAHYDVVDDMGWDEAFIPRVEEGRMIGRGSNDMKGGIAAIICALKRYKEAFGVTPPVKVFMVTDEEEWSKGAWILTEAHKHLFEGLKLLVVPEVGETYQEDDRVKVLIGRRGRLTFNLRLYGRQYHGAFPTLSVNPIYQLGRAIEALQGLELFDPELSLYDTLTPLSARTPSYQLTTPRYLDITLDLHYTRRFVEENGLDLSDEAFERAVAGLITYLLKRRGLEGFEVKLVDRPTPFPKLWYEDKGMVKGMLERWLGSRATGLEYVVGASVADENVLARLKVDFKELTIIDICPVGGNSHADYEWVSLESLSQICHIFVKLIEALSLRNA